jgi:hypothetical protein
MLPQAVVLALQCSCTARHSRSRLPARAALSDAPWPQVPPAAAKHLALAAIHTKEMSVADAQLREAFQADEVRLVDLRLAPLQFRAHPVYVPAHVFSSWYYGVKLRTFVSGVDAAAVAGTRVYDREKVGLLTGFVGLAAALVSGRPPPPAAARASRVLDVAVGAVSLRVPRSDSLQPCRRNLVAGSIHRYSTGCAR